MDISSKKAITPDQLMGLVNQIDDKKLQGFIKQIEKITKDDINPMEFSIFDFVGFDPFKIIKVMMAVSEYHGDKVETLISDIRFAIAANIFMGNLQSKASTKRNEAGKSKLDYLCSKYNISMGSTGSGISPEQVTFPRVAASFPQLAILMAWKLEPKAVNLEFLSRKVPKYMRIGPFCSICDSSIPLRTQTFLMEAANAYSSDMGIAYEKGRLKKARKEVKYDPIQIATDQWSFAEIASNSPVPDKETKQNLFLRLNVAADYDDLKEVVQNYRAITQKKDIMSIDVISKQELEEDITTFSTSSS